MWTTAIATLGVMAVLVTLMAVGVLLGRRPIEPECEALKRLSIREGVALCSACDVTEECALKKAGLIRSSHAGAAPPVRAA